MTARLSKGLGAAVKALKALEKNDLRLREDATPEERQLVFEARKTIIEVMMKPRRYSQMRLAAAAQIIDEVCGKLTDKVDLKSQQNVEVVIHEGKHVEPL